MARQVALVGEAGLRGGLRDGPAGAQQRGRTRHAQLRLEGVRRHPRLLGEDAAEVVRAQVGDARQLFERDVLGVVRGEVFARPPHGPALGPARLSGRTALGVARDEAGQQPDEQRLTFEARRRPLQRAVQPDVLPDEVVVVDDGGREEGRLGAGQAGPGGGVAHRVGPDEERAVATAVAAAGAVRVDLAGVDHEEAGGRRRQVAAAVDELPPAGLDQAELVLLVPVARDGPRDAEAAPRLQMADAFGPPDLDEVAPLSRVRHAHHARRLRLLTPRRVRVDDGGRVDCGTESGARV